MKKSKKKDIIHERVQNAIEMVDLNGKEKKYPSQLSGGGNSKG